MHRRFSISKTVKEKSFDLVNRAKALFFITNPWLAAWERVGTILQEVS